MPSTTVRGDWRYAFWAAAFAFALRLESFAVVARDVAQRRKMTFVQPVPEFWESSRSW